MPPAPNATGLPPEATLAEPVAQTTVAEKTWPAQIEYDPPGPCAEASVGATGVGLIVTVKLATAVLEQPCELTQAIS